MIARKAPLIVIIFVCFVAVGYFFLQNSNEEDLDDFAAELESLVQTSSVSENMEFLASKPHRAGTPENHRVGDRIISELKSMGAKVWTEQHTVSLPQPGKASLVLTAPSIQEIDFLEKPIDGDPYSTISANEPPFFAYVADTDVEGEVIYANFGDRQDYQRFKDQNISLKGKIALVRTQGSCRGMKQLVAEEEGLGALLLYTEPKDQGFKKPSYPQGPNIHPWVAQRGSMLKFFLYPGDPNTPIEDKKENTLPGVPALPITPVAGETILKSLEGSTIEEWKGWMNNSYRTGPGPGRVRLTYTSQNKQMQIRNIFSVVPGMNPGDPPLIVSTHYDAWVYGASDPASGTAVVLEVAKALSELQKKGWRPQRDILFAFWDAEEYGMIGSTRWVTDHLDQARRVGNVLYIDSVRGPMFRATVVPGMRGILDDVLRRFKDPNTGKSILDFHLAYEMPGFSDDTIPFSNLAGAPVAQLNYGIHYSMYHSIYDNLAWMKKFGDPGYAYAGTLARIVALYSIALTRDPILPFRFAEFSAYHERELNRMRLEQDFDAHGFDLILKEVSQLGQLATQLQSFDFENVPPESRHQINTLLQKAVVSFTQQPGRTARPFAFRNVILGPSTDNGCKGTDLPMIKAALLEKNGERLNAELLRLTQHFSEATRILRKAIRIAEEGNGQ